MDARRGRVVVLRLGHRIPRDQRITTHVCLTARALGADAVLVADTHDGQLVETMTRVTADFGGKFSVESGMPWRPLIAEWKRSGGVVVHLTAYGLPLPKVIGTIRRSRHDKMIVVGAEKVPAELYRLADWNVAVTNQPISEVSALGIFLDWLSGHSFRTQFADGKLTILPTEHGKRIIET
ncbi:MAG TPA: tRNA (cytidine(56)-2'-O)-methyltransferase [Candidatus Bathyarchaeia archaeon]|nr:tRNA (cytidine(56)-2'-O)-methyltransferase [Candidatus Bathyarchaeia archaeon]